MCLARCAETPVELSAAKFDKDTWMHVVTNTYRTIFIRVVCTARSATVRQTSVCSLVGATKTVHELMLMYEDEGLPCMCTRLLDVFDTYGVIKRAYECSMICWTFSACHGSRSLPVDDTYNTFS